MIQILLATRNEHKVRELKRMLGAPHVRLLSLSRIDQKIPAVQEDGKSFKANAIKKAVVVSRYVDLPVLAEDSGLEVTALERKPGVHSARYAGPAQDDGANLNKLLRVLQKTPPSRRRARFVCAMALALQGKLLKTFSGACAGSIALKPAGAQGFGYDPVFIPRGMKKTTAQLSSTRKDALSHRGQAARQLRRYLYSRSPTAS